MLNRAMAGPPCAVDLTPVTLRGRVVTLEPLGPGHAGDLFRVMQDAEVVRYLKWPPARDLDEVRAMIVESVELTAKRWNLVFAQVANETGRAIGSTRLLDIRPDDRQVEIGATFLDRAWWRTAANTESKFLLLRHCFETLGCVRVALKTDARNVRSQEAIARLGAVREGVLRRHMRVKGFQRDTVYFSILDEEWPAVRARLEARLGYRAC